MKQMSNIVFLKCLSPANSTHFYTLHYLSRPSVSHFATHMFVSVQSAETSTWQNITLTKETNIHTPGGIRTHDLSTRAAADLRIRPRGHWDQHKIPLLWSI